MKGGGWKALASEEAVECAWRAVAGDRCEFRMERTRMRGPTPRDRIDRSQTETKKNCAGCYCACGMMMEEAASLIHKGQRVRVRARVEERATTRDVPMEARPSEGVDANSARAEKVSREALVSSTTTQREAKRDLLLFFKIRGILYSSETNLAPLKHQRRLQGHPRSAMLTFHSIKNVHVVVWLLNQSSHMIQ